MEMCISLKLSMGYGFPSVPFTLCSLSAKTFGGKQQVSSPLGSVFVPTSLVATRSVTLKST